MKSAFESGSEISVFNYRVVVYDFFLGILESRMEISLCMLFIHSIFPKSYDLPLAKGSESLGHARVETTHSSSVYTSHPTIGDLPCDPMTKKH